MQIINEVFEIFLERRNVKNNEKTGLVAAVTVTDNALRKSTKLGNPDPRMRR